MLRDITLGIAWLALIAVMAMGYHAMQRGDVTMGGIMVILAVMIIFSWRERDGKKRD